MSIAATAAATTPDLAGYHAVHAALRAAPHRMVAAVRDLDPSDRGRTTAFARYWRGFAGEVHAHHTVEDVAFFPDLVARIPSTRTLIDRTDADHHHLDVLMADGTAACERLVAGGDVRSLPVILEALAAHMDEHLDLEDVEVLPLIERTYTPAEYEALERVAIKEVGMGAQAAFSIPFILAAVTPEERARMIGTAPLALRVLHRLTRGRFARLDAAALGPVDDVARS